VSLHVSKALLALIASGACVFAGAVAPPASAATVSEFYPVIASSDPTFHKWNDNSCGTGTYTDPFHYQVFRLDVSEAGTYSYYDVGYETSAPGIDIEVGFYHLGQFNPSSPGDGCIKTIDDIGDVDLPSAGGYTFVITTNNSLDTGMGDFTLTGPGAASLTGMFVASGEKPTQVVQQVGMPANGSCDGIADADLGYGTQVTGGWSASWAQWPYDGVGGPVCTRTLFYSPQTGVWSVLT
jgi:hypothetical protein